jgi:trehalose/maltose hydrolase-like predicted phosphorylase
MTEQGALAVEPWVLRETYLDLGRLAQSESVFALANGYVGWRGNLEEGEPHGLPGSYLNGVYEVRPLPYGEVAYGLPETGQSVINVTNGKLIRLFVDDEPFDVRYGELRAHERLLDFRAGTLNRQAEWVSPAGKRIRVSSTRLVSFTQRSVAAICYEVEALDGAARFAAQSELVANEQLPPRSAGPPTLTTSILTPPGSPAIVRRSPSMTTFAPTSSTSSPRVTSTGDPNWSRRQGSRAAWPHGTPSGGPAASLSIMRCQVAASPTRNTARSA